MYVCIYWNSLRSPMHHVLPSYKKSITTFVLLTRCPCSLARTRQKESVYYLFFFLQLSTCILLFYITIPDKFFTVCR